MKTRTIGSAKFSFNILLGILRRYFTLIIISIFIILISIEGSRNNAFFCLLPSSYTIEKGIEDGCVVYKDLVLVAGQEKLNQFINNSKKGINSKVRIVKTYKSGETFYSDLIYNTDRYYLIDYEDTKEYNYEYLYLLDVKGTMPNAAKSSHFIVLANVNTLNFEQVSKTIYSSNSKDLLDLKFVIME